METKQDILQTIVANKRKELTVQKELCDQATLEHRVEAILEKEDTTTRSMKWSLNTSDTGIIAEFKRKSPSKGWIKEDGKPTVIPPSYAESGAAALSILTDEKFFGGELDYIRQARPLVPSTPILRKDFIIDEYQLLQAKAIGADAVLLIAACLSKEECKQLASKAKELRIESLLEIHTAEELDWVNEHVDMIGVNNRHLGTFHTDVQTSYDLARRLPSAFTLVSESGISNPQTVKELRDAGFRGFLIGETFMKEPHPGEALRQFIQEVRS